MGFRIPRVRPQGEEEEEGAEDIFALGNPGDGFDVQGVQGEQGGDQSARPDGTGELAEQPEQQEAIGKMQGQIHQMVACGMNAKELAIGHVREPG